MISVKAFLSFFKGEAALRLCALIIAIAFLFNSWQVDTDKPIIPPTVTAVPTLTIEPTHLPPAFHCYPFVGTKSPKGNDVTSGDYICVITTEVAP